MGFEAILAIILFAGANLAFAAVYIAIPLLMPVFRRYAMARPGARSSHREPTPQGGGAPVVAATVLITLVMGVTGIYASVPVEVAQYQTLVLLGAVALAMLGAADDIQPMPARSRLVMQCLVATIIAFGAPDEWRLLPEVLPLVIERGLTTIAFVWMVNLTNFMDGIDGIVAAHTVPAGVALAIFAALGALDARAGMAAATLAGAMAAFALFNRHPARLFLGDVGSLAIGFVLAGLLFQLAATQSVAAALLLPAFFLTDATTTLLAGWRAGHDLTRAHRRHAYQNAVDGGWSQPEVTRTVLMLNGALAVLAWLALTASSPLVEAIVLALGYGATFAVIHRFRQPRGAGPVAS